MGLEFYFLSLCVTSALITSSDLIECFSEYFFNFLKFNLFFFLVFISFWKKGPYFFLRENIDYWDYVPFPFAAGLQCVLELFMEMQLLILVDHCRCVPAYNI